MKVGFNSLNSFKNYNQINQNKSESVAKNKQNINFGEGHFALKPKQIHLLDQALWYIKQNGFELLDIRESIWKKAEATEHYAGLLMDANAEMAKGSGKLLDIYDTVIADMTSGPLIDAIVKGGEGKINAFKEFTGATNYKTRDPKSLRGYLESIERNRLINEEGYSPEELDAYFKRYTITHASDTKLFNPSDKNSIKNNIREVKLHRPDYIIQNP